MTEQEAIKILELIRAAYPHRFKLNKDTAIEFWVNKLTPLPYQAVYQAVDAHTDISENPPTIANIKRRIGQGGSLSPLVAWNRLKKAVIHFGIYGKKQVMDVMPPEYRSIVDGIGGWDALCRMDEDVAQQRVTQWVEEMNLNHLSPALPDNAIAGELTGGLN